MSECEDCGLDPCYCGRCLNCETGDRVSGNFFCDGCAQRLAAEGWIHWEPGQVKPIGEHSPAKRLAAAEAALDVKNLTIKNLSEVVEDRGVSIGCMSRQLTECKQKLATTERVLECGHTARFTTSHFGGEKHGESYCTLCDLDAANARLAAAEAANAQQSLTIEGQGNRISQLKECLAFAESLLREADQIMAEMPYYNGSTAMWRAKVKAALEGKP